MKRWTDDLRRGDHAAHVYKTDGEQAKALVDLIAWMREGERLILLSDRWESSPRSNRFRVLDAAVEEGHLDILPAKRSLSPSGRFRAESLVDVINMELSKATDEGCSGLVVLWDLDWLSGNSTDFEAHIVQQSKLMLASLPMNLTLMGQYGTDSFSTEQVERVLQVNQLVLEDGRLTRNFWVLSTSAIGGPPRDNNPSNQRVRTGAVPIK